jgi:MFS family permease
LKPLHHYLAGTGSWFVSHGIQAVLFAWLVTMVLQESPGRVGLAQMAMLLPATFLLLIGGSLADQFGGRRIAVIAQSLAVLPPLALLFVIAAERLTFQTMIGYALVMGSIQAFVTPARDGLLNQVAAGRIQRTVLLVSMIQFGVQMLGFLVASRADAVGAVPILALQVLVIAYGAFALSRLPVGIAPPRPQGQPLRRLARSISEGSSAALGSPTVRAVLILNSAMAMFFMGSYIVAVPLLIRDVYDGSSADLASVNAINALGLVMTIMFIYQRGDIHHKGRALLVSHLLGAAFLALAGAGFGFGVVLAVLFGWGACGGIAMTMARTIVQELAADGIRSRVMAFFSLSFLGAGPIGALLSGYLVDRVGAGHALMVSAAAMACVLVAVALLSNLWRLANIVEQRGEAVAPAQR